MQSALTLTPENPASDVLQGAETFHFVVLKRLHAGPRADAGGGQAPDRANPAGGARSPGAGRQGERGARADRAGAGGRKILCRCRRDRRPEGRGLPGVFAHGVELRIPRFAADDSGRPGIVGRRARASRCPPTTAPTWCMSSSACRAEADKFAAARTGWRTICACSSRRLQRASGCTRDARRPACACAATCASCRIISPGMVRPANPRRLVATCPRKSNRSLTTPLRTLRWASWRRRRSVIDAASDWIRRCYDAGTRWVWR